MKINDALQSLVTPIDTLKTDERNARTHGRRNLQAIKDSLDTYGQQKPIVALADGTVIAGNGTLEAARALGWEGLAVVTFDDAKKARAFALADNRTAELADWDLDELRRQLADLGNLQASLIGFDEGELEALLAGEEPAKVPDPKEPPEHPEARLGDLYQLGRHRLLCGDSTSEADVARLLGGARPFLMVTDPPYGVRYDPKWRQDVAEPLGPISGGKVEGDHQVDWRDAWALFPGAVAYVWHAGIHAAEVSRGLHQAGFEIRAQLIWVKQVGVFGRGAYHWQHEPCWYAVRKGSTAAWKGGRKQTTVWEIANAGAMGGQIDDVKTSHGTQKPLACMAQPIKNHGGRGKTAVYDPFLGSGTTLIAAEDLQRECFAMELDPAYVDVSIDRWERLTGEKAKKL